MGRAGIGLAVYALTFGVQLMLLPPLGLQPPAWAGLWTAGALGTLVAGRCRTPWGGTAGWLFTAGLCALLAALFSGANFALDALHGADRAKANVAAALGGLELWMVLCPAGSALALGAWAQAR